MCGVADVLRRRRLTTIDSAKSAPPGEHLLKEKTCRRQGATPEDPVLQAVADVRQLLRQEQAGGDAKHQQCVMEEDVEERLSCLVEVLRGTQVSAEDAGVVMALLQG